MTPIEPIKKTELHLEMDAAWNKYEELREAVREEERSVIIPERRAKYEGKYFKGILRHAMIYSFVTGINHSRDIQAFTFRLPEFDSDFFFEYAFGISIVQDYVTQEEITKDDFFKAFGVFIEKLHSSKTSCDLNQVRK